MTARTLVVLGTALALAAGATQAAAAPSTVTIKQRQTIKMKPNRFLQDGLRWDKDVYTVRSGGTLHLVDNVVTEGPHTFTVVRRRDLPRNAAQLQNCKVCDQLEAAHGADPNTEGPPKFPFLENGVGTTTPPNIDRPGDSAVIGNGTQGESLDLTVTAKKGTTLSFLCLIHPWMQARLRVR